jgi:hypothetical protein
MTVYRRCVKMIKTGMDENHEIWKENTDRITQGTTDLIKRDQVPDRITAYLSDTPLNIGKDEYCYVKIVRNHLEIGRAKIQLEE